MTRRLLAVVLVLATCLAGSAQADILLGDKAPALDVTQDGKAALSFHVEVGRINTIDVATKGGLFTRLVIPGFHSSKIEGAPELPMMNRLIAVPVGATADVTLSNVVTRRVKLADFGVTNPIMPAQPSLSKSADPALVPFVHDRGAYLQAEVRQEPARLVPQGRLRAMDLSLLQLSPVAWLPGSDELEIIESMDVTVTYSGADAKAAGDLVAATYSPFFEFLYSGIAGAKGFHDGYPDRVGDQVTMVIVTPPMFAGQLADFAAWKTERGFNVIMAVTGTPAVGTTTTEIQAYLHDLYNNATPEQPAPSFVLFVGDVAEMPTFFEAGDATDRPYCAVDGDLVPDMYYGRFSAENPTQLQAQLDKTMMYDQFTMPDPGYLDTVTLIAGVDGSWAPTHGNGQINYGTATYFNAAHGLTSNTYLYPASSGAVEGEIIQTVNDGVALINYTAHGSETGWYDPAMTQSDINGMTNAGKYGLAIGNCCLTSTYDYAECMGETWLRAANKGAVGYIGGSNSTYWDEDYWWGVGYHPSSEIDGTAWPYESTGMGAYDGVFHDHGEAETQWYVTNDAIVFCGNLAVMESGSSRTTYYWNIYNLLGDPSLSTYLAPVANTVSHPTTVFVGTTSLTVGADEGSYVGLTQGGVLMGSGTVGVGGAVDLTYLAPLTPGVPMKLVVTAQNRVPYITDLNVIVPATVTIDPMVIDVNVPTAITVTVLDADGVLPQPGIEVWAEGLQYATTPVVTDASGVAVINVTAAYGPTLDIVGQDPAETYRLFTEPVTVNAAQLAAPDLTVTTDIGLSDSFALNLPGTLHATVAEGGHTLYAQLPGGSLLQTTAADLVLTPAALGEVTGIIAVSGYDLYTETFPIIEAYGTVAGTVASGGTPLAGVTVDCVDGGGTVFSVVTAADGTWAAPEEVLVADYTLTISHFGYLPFAQPIFVNYGANTFDLELTPAPAGDFSGVVIDAVDFTPLQGTVRVYRSDTGELYNEVTCAADGSFLVSALPYFDYNVQVRAYHHKPVYLALTIEQASTVKNFALEPTTGDLLVIDDGAKSYDHPAKFAEKPVGTLLAEGYEAPPAKSAQQIAMDLEDMGYFATVVGADVVDVSTFGDYDVVVLACGNNTTTLQNAALKAALIDFAELGGHLLLEGGELGYDQYGDTEFGTKVMHTTDWNHDSSGTLAVNDPAAFILNHPNAAAVPLGFTYAGYGDSDAMAPLPDAAWPMTWTSYPTDASVITYDPNPAPEGGQIVFFCFNYDAADVGRFELLENAVQWLVTPEVGNCSISGQVLLAGETDHSGVTITATPNGGLVTTGPDGAFTLTGLYAGTYTVTAQKAGWSTAVEQVTMSDGEQYTGMAFVLTPTNEVTLCKAPAAPIVDYGEVSDTIVCDTEGTVSAIEVFVDITHTYRGDLIVGLTSPTGTQVLLHNRTGLGADNLYGWYPSDLDPAEDLGVLIGEDMQGEWMLTISDNAGGDTGTFNEWCVRITYAGGVVAVGPVPIVATNVAGGTQLTWTGDTTGIDGYNVYRRIPGSPAVRLNNVPVSASGGAISFVDAGEGLTVGQVVYYSFAVVQGGREVGYSGEIQVTIAAATPRAFALRGNRPNPFNPSTTICFDLPVAGYVRVSIYDVAGRLVRTLVDGPRPAAAHAELWDGRDDGGRQVSSGVYYYRVVTERNAATGKMMLLK